MKKWSQVLQEVLDDRELKVMKLIEHLGELIRIQDTCGTKTGAENDLTAPQWSVPVPGYTNECLLNRNLDILGASLKTIRRAVERADSVNTHLLTN